MTVLSLRLPESLHRKLAELAESEGISINQLINSAIAEKMAALLTEEYLSERGSRGDRRKFVAALGKAPDAEPRETDRIPERSPKKGAKRAR
jgi:post-segregation antitoxin (ccd killing protein)